MHSFMYQLPYAILQVTQSAADFRNNSYRIIGDSMGINKE